MEQLLFAFCGSHLQNHSCHAALRFPLPTPTACCWPGTFWAQKVQKTITKVDNSTVSDPDLEVAGSLLKTSNTLFLIWANWPSLRSSRGGDCCWQILYVGKALIGPSKPPAVLQYSLCPWKCGCEGPECFDRPKVTLRRAQKSCAHISRALSSAQISWPCEIPRSPQHFAFPAGWGQLQQHLEPDTLGVVYPAPLFPQPWTSFVVDKFTRC